VEPVARKGKGKNIDRMKAAAETQEKCRLSSNLSKERTDPRKERTDPAWRVDCAARSQPERRQQQKHKKNVALHQIRAKSEQVRHLEWILQQGVNEAATQKSKWKKKDKE
jgi:hypothetical protein